MSNNTYIDMKVKQMMFWINGKSTHDDVYNECCLDNSCCYPDLFITDLNLRTEMATRYLNELKAFREVERSRGL